VACLAASERTSFGFAPALPGAFSFTNHAVQLTAPLLQFRDVGQTSLTATAFTTGLSYDEGRVSNLGASFGMTVQTHWDKIYAEKAPETLSAGTVRTSRHPSNS
jgi:hypothetical protein